MRSPNDALFRREIHVKRKDKSSELTLARESAAATRQDDTIAEPESKGKTAEGVIGRLKSPGTHRLRKKPEAE